MLGLFVWRAVATLDYTWRWPLLAHYIFFTNAQGKLTLGLLAQGLLTTIKLSAWIILFATFVGFAMGMARASQNYFCQLVSRAYVELVRNIPPLVLIFIFYFFLANQIMEALHLDEAVQNAPLWLQKFLELCMAPKANLPNFLAALLTMTVYEGAFITEHVRAGIQSIDPGQREAAWALGLTRWQRMRCIILPQAMGQILPPLTGQCISIIKDTTIVSVISVQELTFQGLELMASTYMTFEIMITLTVLYLLLTLFCSMLAHTLELKLKARWG